MARKVAFLMLFLTGLMPLACCPEPPSGPYQLQLKGLQLLKSGYLHPRSGHYSNHLVPEGETYKEDTLVIHLGFSFDFVASTVPFSFQHMALATSCPDEPLYTLLQDPITAIDLYSNQPFDEIPAGEPLNSSVFMLDEQQGSALTIQEAISRINSMNGYHFMHSKLSAMALTQKPEDALERNFTVRIRYHSGREETATTLPIVWE